MGRGPADFARAHGRAWTLDDRHAVMGANSRQWSRDDARAAATSTCRREAIEAAIVDGVVERYDREGAPTIDGAVDAVRRIAARWPTALASSSHRRVIDAALAATGLTDAFRAVVSSDEVAHGKPAPDVFLEAARRLGADPPTTLVVEDSLNGLQAGRAAGMTTVLVPNRSVPPARGRRGVRRSSSSSASPTSTRSDSDRGRASRAPAAGARRPRARIAGHPAAARHRRPPSGPPDAPGLALADRVVARRPRRTSGSASRAASGCRRARRSTASTT